MKSRILVVISVFGAFVAPSVFAQPNTFPSSGNAGVGTTNPNSQLQINNWGVIDENNGWANFGSNSYYGGGGWQRIDTSKSGVNLHMNSSENASGSEFRFFLMEANGFPRNIATIGTGYNYFESNVGIGTSSPDYRLDVNGPIRAKEIFVETGWSDFVFEEGYELPTLDEVSSHIERFGHLPGIPSAKQIEEGGLAVGQAQTLMMQKIEELTLYMLQLSDENAQLRKEMEELRREVTN